MRVLPIAGIAVALALAASPARAQQECPTPSNPTAPCIFTTETLPMFFSLSWTPTPTTDKEPVDGYEVFLDGAALPNGGRVPGQSATGLAGMLVGSIGSHTVSVRAYNTKGVSPEAKIDFQVQLLIVITAPTTPPTQLKLLLTPAVTGGSSSTLVSAPFTDPLGHRWALVGDDVQRDGVHAEQAGPCDKLILVNGIVYAGAAGRWYRWSEALPHWTDVGTETPQ